MSSQNNNQSNNSNITSSPHTIDCGNIEKSPSTNAAVINDGSSDDSNDDNNNNNNNNIEENQKTWKKSNHSPIIRHSPVVREAEEKILQAFAKHPNTVKISDLFNPLVRTKSVGEGSNAGSSSGGGAVAGSSGGGGNSVYGLLPPPAYNRKKYNLESQNNINQSPLPFSTDTIYQKESEDSFRSRQTSIPQEQEQHTHNLDDGVSVLSLPSTKKTIAFTEGKSAYTEEAELAIIQVMQDLDEAIDNEEFLPVLKGVPSETVQLLENLITDTDTISSNDKSNTLEVNKEEEERLLTTQEGNQGESIGTSEGSKKLKSIARRLIMIEKLKSKRLFVDSESSEKVIEPSTNESSNFIGKANEVMRLNEMAQIVESDDDIDSADAEIQQGQSLNSYNKADEEKASGKQYCRCYSRSLNRIFKLIYRKRGAIMQSLYTFVVAEIALVGTAALIYYGFKNPIAVQASYSWYFLLAARFLVTFELAVLVEAFLIDFLFVETKLAVWFLGRFLTLMAVQAKGWPLRAVFWGIANLVLLRGNANHVESWISWPSFIENSVPHPTLLNSGTYQLVLICLIIVGVAVMIKRATIVAVVGKKKYKMYGPQLEELMSKILLISDVALLADEIECTTTEMGGSKQKLSKNLKSNTSMKGWLYSDASPPTSNKDLSGLEFIDNSDYLIEKSAHDMEYNKKEERKPGAWSWLPKNKVFSSALLKQANKKLDRLIERRSSSTTLETTALLGGEWKEPLKKDDDKVSILKILEFREALNYLRGPNPLSANFGAARTRKECMESAIRLFKRLQDGNSLSLTISFKTLAALALDSKGSLQKELAKPLINLFRPDRDGNISLLHFIQACDNVYKEVRMLSATVANSTQMDDAIESMVNFLFFALLSLVVLNILGMYRFAITFWLSVIAPFTFLFKTAVSIWVEGLLLMLLRKPFDIGDRIAVSDPEKDTNVDGSTTWFVDKFSIFSTTVRNAATNEVATYNNGYLAGTRIINAARSPNAQVFIHLKFGIDVSFEKIKLFKSTIESFVQDRPQEWVSLLGFRATTLRPDLGYYAYVVVLKHVESWQNIGLILNSKADLSSFCLEVSKQLDMPFIAPPEPVELYVDGS